MERISFNELPNGFYNSIYAVENYLSKSTLDHQLLELMRFRVSQINNCTYCLDMHFKEAKAAKETDLRLYSLSAWREAPYYSDRERAVLNFAEKLTLIHTNDISDEVYEALNTFFTKEEVADLTLAISQINTWNRLTAVCRFTPGKYEVKEQTVTL